MEANHRTPATTPVVFRAQAWTLLAHLEFITLPLMGSVLYFWGYIWSPPGHTDRVVFTAFQALFLAMAAVITLSAWPHRVFTIDERGLHFERGPIAGSFSVAWDRIARVVFASQRVALVPPWTVILVGRSARPLATFSTGMFGRGAAFEAALRVRFAEEGILIRHTDWRGAAWWRWRRRKRPVVD